MEYLGKPKPQETFFVKQCEFIDALSELFSYRFHDEWIPIFAKTCYRETQKVEEKKRADIMRQVLVARSDWMQNLRIQILHDLAKYIQANESQFDGNRQTWMQERLTEIWSEACTQETFLEWFARACDDTTDLESWRAPSWLPAALEISNMKVRLQETSDDSDCDRLDLKSTDGLLSRFFLLREAYRQLKSLSQLEQETIAELQVFISQGAKIPLGLHSNHEESLLSVISRQSKSEFKDGKRKPTNKLPPKKRDFSDYLDGAKLTSLQREVMSLRLEYEMSVPEIAVWLGKSRKTIAGHIEAAAKKFQEASSNLRNAKLRAAKPSCDYD